MASTKDKLKKGGQEITLMTILANEATGPSRKILKEYGQPDAKNYQDLEIKLAELYFNTKDKVVLEKKLAEIHPHKNWILKNVQPVIEEISKQVQVEEVKSNASGDNMCPQCQRQPFTDRTFFSAEGPTTPKVGVEALIVPMMLFAMIGVTFVFVAKTIK
jgi:hypothetical protein